MIYYNDNDPFACAWLRQLQAVGELLRGTIDPRPIQDVQGSELGTTCHFFAGIGGWPYALRLAGWPADRPVWTGSCPCQPFSAAGKRRGTADARHLWPEFRRLIAECRPTTIFGEQVASRAGREWLAGVRADLEELGYAVGAADLCAAGAGAPHIRQRLFWGASRMADAGAQGRRALLRSERADWRSEIEPAGHGDAFGMGDPLGPRLEERASERRDDEPQCAAVERAGGATGRLGDTTECGFWSDAIWLPCLDGKARRIEPGTFPLAPRLSARVGRLRGYGNAIVPQVAAQFIRAFM